MTIIGVAGTAKNTGKTTTLKALVGNAGELQRRLGITGIGYDGEDRDTVTRLPKPRIPVEPGMLVSTSTSCLSQSTAQGEVVGRTGLSTPLGEVVLLRIATAGSIVIAGPNTHAGLRDVCRRLREEGVEITIVDGSLNRIVPMAIADAVVFATGASRSLDRGTVVREMMGIEGLFGLGRCEDPGYGGSGIWMKGNDVQICMAGSQVHERADAERVLRWMPDGVSEMGVPGVITPEALVRIAEGLQQRRCAPRIVLDDPMKLLVAGDPWHVWSAVRRLVDQGASVVYRSLPRLAAVTVNPTYPAFDGTTYTPGLLEGDDLLTEMKAKLRTFVTDIVAEQTGAQVLGRCLFGEPGSQSATPVNV